MVLGFSDCELFNNGFWSFSRFTVRVNDGPGGVSKLCNLLAELGVSIKDIMHDRAFIRDVHSVEVGGPFWLREEGKVSCRYKCS